MRHLRLNENQDSKFVTYLKTRLRELDSDNKARIDADKFSDLLYENSRQDRAKAGGVFAESNMCVPLISTVVDHFASRSEEEVYARDPMASFGPEGPADADTARGLDRFLSYKLFKKGKVRDDLLESNHTIFRHRAQFLKATYFETVDEWVEYDVSVLHSASDQQPVLILEHGYVIEGRDKFVDVVDPIDGPVKVLEKDPTVVLNPTKPNEYYFKPLAKPIKFRDVFYAGAKSREVDSDCIRIPNSARSLDEADIIVEYYDKPLTWVKGRFCERAGFTYADYEAKVRNQGNGRKTEDERKKASKENEAFDLDSTSIGIAEIWIERDILEWGQTQRCVFWYDKKNEVLIDYEYQKKVTPHGRHPFTATAVARTKQFWWGLSLPEVLQGFQEYVDLQWNRHSFRNSINSNPIIGQNPEAIVEKKSFHQIKPFDVMTLEQGKTMQDWLQAFVFPNADTDTQELIDKAVDFVKFWLGISNIARGDYSDVPQNTTLGGQEASLKEASKLSRRWTRRVVKGNEEHITKLAQITLATMDPQEVYVYLEGEKAQMGFITEDSVRDFIVNAKLVVGKDSNTQALQEQQLTLQTVTQYMTYPPQMQVIVRPVMKRILFLLGHDDVESLLPIPMVPTIDPLTGKTVMVPATAQGGQPPAPTAAPGAPEQVPAAAPASGAALPAPVALNAAPGAVTPFSPTAQA